MANEVCARANTDQSADLTITEEYLVVKGNHYNMRNGYLYRSSQTQAISVKDILNVGYFKVYSKRLLMIFILLMTIVIFGAFGVYKLISVSKQLDREIQKYENIYNYIADEDIDIDITKIIKNALFKVGLVGVVIIYIVLILSSALCLLLYLLRPFRVFYISSLGHMIAVERKFYDKETLDNIINYYYNVCMMNRMGK